MREYTCPVCGYDQLMRPPAEFTICPSCGTEFSYTDATATHEELRNAWIRSGMHWHSRRRNPPPGWNPALQLLRAGYGFTTNVGPDTLNSRFVQGSKLWRYPTDQTQIS